MFKHNEIIEILYLMVYPGHMLLTPSEQEEKKDRDLRNYREIYNNAIKDMNSIIFVISTGMFVLSVTFIGYIKSYLHAEWALISSWIFIAITIVLNFSAHFYTSKTTNKKIKILNKFSLYTFVDYDIYKKNHVDENPDVLEFERKGKFTNYVIASLSLALVLLLIFGIINLINQNNLNKKNIKQSLSCNTSQTTTGTLTICTWG